MEDDLKAKVFSVTLEYDPLNGNVRFERWINEHGRLDRIGDLPAYVEYDPETGIPIAERWHNGESKVGGHRTGGKPSAIYRSARTGKTIGMSYELMGQFHRGGNKPAAIHWNEDGKLIREAYYKEGKLSRDPNLGPALIEYDGSTGKVSNSQYWLEGKNLGSARIAFNNRPR